MPALLSLTSNYISVVVASHVATAALRRRPGPGRTGSDGRRDTQVQSPGAPRRPSVPDVRPAVRGVAPPSVPSESVDSAVCGLIEGQACEFRVGFVARAVPSLS